MRMLRNLVAFIGFVSIFSISCKKERSFEDLSPSVNIDQEWEFKQDTRTFSGPMDSASIQPIGVATSLSMSGLSKNGQGQFILQFVTGSAIVPGDYKNPQVLFQYSEGGEVLFENHSDLDRNFTVTISTVTDDFVTGTFTGSVIDAAGNTQTITEGKFTAPIGSLSAQPVADPGQVTVWSKQLCSIGGTIHVIAGDTSADITAALATEPVCGDAGTTTFTLPAGPYAIQAICGNDTVVYDINVIAGNCTVLEVAFEEKDYFPLRNAWVYGNTADYDNDKLTISSGTETVFDGKTYTPFLNDRTSRTHYYRKDNGVYYEYVENVDGVPLTDPVEIVILDENATAEWESSPYEVDYSVSGPPLKLTVKLKSRITNVNFTQTINGRNYSNLIEVTTDLYSRNPDGSYSFSGSSKRTIFAKGVGVVFYQDLSTGIDWGLNSYTD